jgi:hypothetical protein
MSNRNPQDVSSEDEEWNALRPTPSNKTDAQLIELMRRRLAQIDLTAPYRVQCMPAPLPVSWTVEKTSIPTPERKLAEMCSVCVRAKAVCTCYHKEDAS